MRVLNLTDAQQTDSARKYPLGSVAAVFDATYGPLKVVYCYIQDVVTTANCSPVFEDVTAGKWYVDEDENESGVIGQEFCCGAFMTGAATAAATYGWVLVAGLNPLAMLTNSSDVAAGDLLIATATDGTWSGLANTIAVSTTTNICYLLGYAAAVARAADSSNALAAGNAMFNSIWGGLPVTWE